MADQMYMDVIASATKGETMIEEAREYVQRLLDRLMYGVYDEDLDGDLKTVLEEIERILR